MKFKIIGIFCLVVLVLVGIVVIANRQSSLTNTSTEIFSPTVSLPAERPENLVIILIQDGGMLSKSSTTTIQIPEGEYLVQENGKASRQVFSVTEEDMERLYKIFQDNQLDQLRAFKAGVSDRGGTTITVSWDQASVVVSNAANRFIVEDDQERFKLIVEGIQNIMEEKLSISL